MIDKYGVLKLENQVCFPLYACSKEVIKKYKDYLEKIDLTYTQYIAMMVLWDKKEVNVKELGECLYLDSGTLTPVLKKLEQKGYITRERSKTDERNLSVKLTLEGEKIKEEAVHIPGEIAKESNLSMDEVKTLYSLLYKMLDKK